MFYYSFNASETCFFAFNFLKICQIFLWLYMYCVHLLVKECFTLPSCPGHCFKKRFLIWVSLFTWLIKGLDWTLITFPTTAITPDVSLSHNHHSQGFLPLICFATHDICQKMYWYSLESLSYAVMTWVLKQQTILPFSFLFCNSVFLCLTQLSSHFKLFQTSVNNLMYIQCSIRLLSTPL